VEVVEKGSGVAPVASDRPAMSHCCVVNSFIWTSLTTRGEVAWVGVLAEPALRAGGRRSRPTSWTPRRMAAVKREVQDAVIVRTPVSWRRITGD
jgi:hypothetical protein